MTRVSATSGVPYVAVLAYVGATTACCLLPILAFGTDAAKISTYEAGISTVLVLIVYALTNAALPIYILRTPGERLSPFQHLVLPIVGTAVVGYGAWESITPDQPAPADTFWIYALVMVAVALMAPLAAARRASGPLETLGAGAAGVAGAGGAAHSL